MQQRCLEVRALGRVGYANALDLQKELESEVIAERKSDYLLLLEHPHTYTLGRRSKGDGVLATAEMLGQMGVEQFLGLVDHADCLAGDLLVVVLAAFYLQA